MSIEIDCISNIDKISVLIDRAYIKGLESIGLAAEGYAKAKCPVDTGRLRNSITHKVSASEKAVYIGTNVKYGKYVEYGTGQQSSVGGNPLIKGMRPRPYLTPAATEHRDKYNTIMKNAMKDG